MSASKRPQIRQHQLPLSSSPMTDGLDSGSTMTFLPQTIVSGGQTGVDRAALDVAMERGIAHGGWCPLGRLAEDGHVPEQYLLRETGSADYPVRTEQNVIDSSATLILYATKITGGTRLTRRFARQHRRPCLLTDLSQPDWATELQRAKRWLEDCRPDVLNVAGPRESSMAGIGSLAITFLRQLFDSGTPIPDADSHPCG